MGIRVAINGFGRIGRSVFRIAHNDPEIEVVAINDITDNGTLAYLLQYDTVMGNFSERVSFTDDLLKTSRWETKMYSEREPKKLPWKELNVDIVLESTGVFRQRDQVAMHLEAGAKKAILSVPPKDEVDAMIVLGVNDETLKAEHKIVSNASCTTNCLAPVVKVLDENFGVVQGMMTTVHAYTNDQRLSDTPHKDLRRARAANENIIPTTTGAAKAVGKILPHLAGKLDGQAMRIPLPVGSTVDLVAQLKKSTTVDEINAAMKKAAEGDLKGILQYNEDPIVSSDIIGNPHSSIFDAPFTKVIDGDYIKIISWYDNEWGYSNRCVDMMKLMQKLG